eukprot:g704.t1
MVHASHIQHQALPAVLSGANVLVAAETGSGKTLTYGIPAIENTLNARDAGDRNSKVLVLLPNHELCRQVHGVLAELSRGSELALGIGAPAHDTDVTLCTPGALGRWSNAEVDAYLPSLQLVCLDEADMLVTAHKRPLDRVLQRLRHAERQRYQQGEVNACARRTQIVAAAATVPSGSHRSIEAELMRRVPQCEIVRSQQLHKHIVAADHEFVPVKSGAERLEILLSLLDPTGAAPRAGRALVFCNTAEAAQQLSDLLRTRGVAHSSFHRGIPRHERAAALRAFSSSHGTDGANSDEQGANSCPPRVLVCTDLASRGLDLPQLDLVVQFEFAPDAITHLHRAGRTARAGARGRVVSFYGADSQDLVDAIRGAGAAAIESTFSRKRGFRKRVRKATAAKRDAKVS